ncbi:hypothetical protein [Pullulanibacillus camelliae]|uniref:hypothetical protein n=1 Tax=Pullulanibacillus camelliae TaxID=1707096 RepID=UPI00166ED6B1|nr:hypothetical protein [Pullulanibacillus camelliae]
MKNFFIFLSILVTLIAFFFYLLSLMKLEPLAISGPVFFISILVTVRLITHRKKSTL